MSCGAYAPRIPVRVLGSVCTHGHADHVGAGCGVRAVVGDSALYELCAKDVTVPRANIEQRVRNGGIETPDPVSKRVCLPRRYNRGGRRLPAGDRDAGAYAGRHRPVRRDRAGNIAFVGDTLFLGSHGRTDLSGGDEAAIMRSLSKLAKMLPPDTVCLTGHGDSTTMARELMQNPFMQM